MKIYLNGELSKKKKPRFPSSIMVCFMEMEFLREFVSMMAVSTSSKSTWKDWSYQQKQSYWIYQWN